MSPGNARLVLAGAGLFEGSRFAARRSPVRPAEEMVFRWANEASDRLRPPVWTLMQAGTFATVPVTAGLLAARGRRGLAAQVAVGGTAAWLLAKAAKPLVGRPRPGLILKHVRTRERIAGDLGWVSGHAAVSTTIALVLAPAARPPGRAMLGLVVASTAFGRMYVGAHLPLDVIGGAGLGLMIAGTARAVGRRDSPL